jgi:hypothetical protein
MQIVHKSALAQLWCKRLSASELFELPDNEEDFVKSEGCCKCLAVNDGHQNTGKPDN